MVSTKARSFSAFQGSTARKHAIEAHAAADYSGTGNALNANQPIVRRMIVDSLRYWVAEMHVDGFHFDLTSILARDENGRPLRAGDRTAVPAPRR